jgi:uncharacterized protein YggE
MKPTTFVFNLALMGLVIVLAMGGLRRDGEPAAPVKAQSSEQAECSNMRSVSVSGAAVVNVVPDRALLQLGVQSNGNSPDGVERANRAEIQRVIKAVRSLGVEEKDIATDYYIVYPIYENYDSLRIRGYRIDNTVSITLRDVNLADDVILAALNSGANEVQDVQFYTSELERAGRRRAACYRSVRIHGTNIMVPGGVDARRPFGRRM